MGIDYIGPGPIKSIGWYIGNHYVQVTTDYITEWAEVKALQTNRTMVTAQFLYEFILM
jgi:hypothetical protein